jgi:predicted XRE-type DNA-binding protein
MAERLRKTHREKRRVEADTVTASNGNVFADLGFNDAQELAAKADLARAIRQLIDARALSQREAAPLVGVSQPDLSNLYRRRLDGFSIGRLSRMLIALGQDVQIVVQPKPRSRRLGRLTTLVRSAARKSA